MSATTIKPLSPALATGMRCPHCGDVAYQKNYQTVSIPDHNLRKTFMDLKANFESGVLMICPVCAKITVFIDNKMVYPNSLLITPNPDMPEDTKTIFTEALSIANKSPRAACALLRLCIDNLVDYLGAPKDKKLYEKIRVVANTPMVEDLLEACRLAGNKAVHPSQVNISDNDIDLVKNLADFINVVVDLTITMPNKANAIKNRFSKKDPAS